MLRNTVKILMLGALWLALPAAAVDPSPAIVDARAGEGCWALFFDGAEFKGAQSRLAGSLYINSIAGPGMIGEMSDKAFLKSSRSLIMGPEATLIAYAEPGFRKEIIALAPGEKVKDLRALGFPARIASLKISCN